jgi:hypothetical protein
LQDRFSQDRPWLSALCSAQSDRLIRAPTGCLLPNRRGRWLQPELKTVLLSHLYIKNECFTKTGSGQT